METGALVCIGFKRPGKKLEIVLFSVIIPTYNRAHLLPQTLDSVFVQTCKDYEVIVVDDGSTDGTQGYLKSLGNRVTCLSQSNQGPGAARNLAAQHAEGDYLTFLDSDDLWFPLALDNYSLALKQYGEAAMLIASRIEFTGVVPPTASPSPERFLATSYQDYFQAGSGGSVYVGAGLIAVRRDHFLAVGGFDSRLKCAEDHDLVLRLGEFPGCVVVEAPYQVAYRRHPLSATQKIQNILHGLDTIIGREKRGEYPGGAARSKERRAVIGRIVRPVSLSCLKGHRWKNAWSLYVDLAPWMISEHRWKYLLGFPLISVRSLMEGDA